MGDPLLSVVIPVYNMEHVLRRAASSVCAVTVSVSNT